MLHTVNKSPFERDSLDSCLRVVHPGNAILLIEDGVYAASKGTRVAQRLEKVLTEVSVYALAPDLQARGIRQTDIIEGIEVVDYRGFVQLAVRYDKVQSWL